MEENGTDPLSAGDGLSGAEFDGHGFDTNEEVLLLQTTPTNNEPMSPNLQAVLDNNFDFGWTSGQRQQSPLFMERPRSPGIDAAEFSFAKPAQNGKPFSLQPLIRRPSSGATEEVQTKDKNTIVEKPDGGHSVQEKSTHPSHTGSAGISATPLQDGTLFGTSERGADQSESLLHTTRNTDVRPESRSTVDRPIEQALPVQNPERNQQHVLFEEDQDMNFGASPRTSHEQGPIQPSNGEPRLVRPLSSEHRDSEHNRRTESRTSNKSWKVVKRRRSNNSKPSKRVAYAPSDANVPVSEETLFHQLISRMKAREESEAVASNMQREMEANMRVLREENDALREELGILGVKLQKRSAESRAYKAQNESWKTKLSKIKVFFNELGADYQNLRGEAIHFKAARKTLDKERKEIAESIPEIKGRLSTVSHASLQQSGKLSDAGSLITSLNQELKHVREKVQYSQRQLSDEKKRSRLLENHIQNSTRAQDKKLDLVRSSQHELMKRLESAFEATSRNYESSHAVVNDTFERKLDDILALFRSTAKSFSNDKMNVQQCKEAIQEFQSRLGITTRELSESVGKHSSVADGMMRSMEEQFQAFKNSVGEGSTLLEQLSSNEDRCDHLRAKLEETAPAFQSLESSVDGLQRREVDLGQQMENLETRLVEVKLPDRFEDDYFHISQKLSLENEISQLALKLKATEKDLKTQKIDNAEKQEELCEVSTRAHQEEIKIAKLESQIATLEMGISAVRSERRGLDNEIQKLTLTLKAKEDDCKAQQSDMQQKQSELRELTKRAQQAEGHAVKLESDAADLEGKIIALKKEAQANLDRAIADSQDKCSADFQRRLHEIAMEKAGVEMDAARSKEQLAEVQRRLTDAEELARKEREGLEALLAERQKRIEDLDASRTGQVSNMTTRIQDLESARTEQASKITKREAEIEGLRKHEASLTAKQTVLRDQLDEARRKLNDFESEFMKTSTAEQRSRKELQDSLSALQSRFGKKEEDCQALQESLSSIQNQLVVKEEDCRRCQAKLDIVQIELSGSEAERQTLHDSLLEIQGELTGSKEDCHAFQLEIQAIQGELMANNEQRQHLQNALSALQGNSLDNDAARQALEDTLSSVQSTLTRKEEEHRVLAEQFKETDNVRKSLESGKLKAKAEIHALLKRVQESESSIKSVREVLQRLDVARLELPMPEALGHLERILQATNGNQPTASGKNREVQMLETPVQYSQAEDADEPTEMTLDEPKSPVDQTSNPGPKQTASIVPFSSILKGLSPDHFLMGDGEAFDFSGVVARTPDAPAADELDIPARPEKNGFARNISESKAQGLSGSPKLEHIVSSQKSTSMSTQEQAKPKESNTARKVSFVSRQLTTGKDGLQVPDSQEKNNHSNFLESSLGGDHPPRANRWTYSKRQRETAKQETASSGKIPSQSEENETRKKVKTSSASGSTQERTASDLYERRRSPTRLASGSSRTANVSNLDHMGAARGKRRSTRKTRGDKYNARFSQGAQA